MGWWGIAWTLSRCALNASAGIAKRKQFQRCVFVVVTHLFLCPLPGITNIRF